MISSLAMNANRMSQFEDTSNNFTKIIDIANMFKICNALIHYNFRDFH